MINIVVNILLIGILLVVGLITGIGEQGAIMA